MKFLEFLTSASLIAMLVGCAGNETGEKGMPVPLPEKGEVMKDVLSENTGKTRSMFADTPDGMTTDIEAGTVKQNAPATGKSVRKDATAKTEETVTDEEEIPAAKEVPSEYTAAKKDTATVNEPRTGNVDPDKAPPAEKETASMDMPSEKHDGGRPSRGKCSRSGWYAGIEGGLDFAESGMSSFGAGGTRAGGGAGLAVGYRFNSWLSLEFGMAFGKTRMTAYGCCSDANLWLSEEGETFNAAVFGMNGGYYSELESAVFFQKYGLRANFDILGLIPGTADGKWSLELSPEVFVLGPDAKVSKADAVIYRAASRQAGLGGRIQAGYAFLPWMSAGVFTGMDFGLGRHIDALPQNGHKRNYIWESGVRLVFSIPDKNSGR